MEAVRPGRCLRGNVTATGRSPLQPGHLLGGRGQLLRDVAGVQQAFPLLKTPKQTSERTGAGTGGDERRRVRTGHLKPCRWRAHEATMGTTKEQSCRASRPPGHRQRPFWGLEAVLPAPRFSMLLRELAAFGAQEKPWLPWGPSRHALHREVRSMRKDRAVGGAQAGTHQHGLSGSPWSRVHAEPRVWPHLEAGSLQIPSAKRRPEWWVFNAYGQVLTRGNGGNRQMDTDEST